jgi:hypothetical protein
MGINNYEYRLPLFNLVLLICFYLTGCAVSKLTNNQIVEIEESKSKRYFNSQYESDSAYVIHAESIREKIASGSTIWFVFLIVLCALTQNHFNVILMHSLKMYQI